MISTADAYLLRTNTGKLHVMTRGSHGYALCGRYVTGIIANSGEPTCATCRDRHAAGATEPRRNAQRRALAARLADPQNH